MATDRSGRRTSDSRLSSTQRQRRRTVLILACIAAVALAASTIWALTKKPLENLVLRESCTASLSGTDYTLTPDQARYAALIASVSAQRQMPERAATVALSTALQESQLTNLDYGDQAGPDSRGLFQQRSSQGWGTESQIMDPLYASNAFYDALEKVSGWEQMSITAAAQSVQHSAYPDAYAQHEPAARAFAAALRGQSQQALTCQLRPAESSGVPDTVLTQLSSEMGLKGTVRGSTAWVPTSSEAQAWSAAQWAVAEAQALSIDSVSVNGRQWTRSSGTWESIAQPEGAAQNTVLITVH